VGLRRDLRLPSAPILASGDAAALLLFVVVGLRSHDASSTAAAIARTALPLLGSWFAVAAVTGCYRRPSLRTTALTWAVSVPLAVLVRTLVLGHPTGRDLVTFLVVTLTVTGVFVAAWRLVAGALGSILARRHDPAGA
jgi:hypothetical protein